MTTSNELATLRDSVIEGEIIPPGSIVLHASDVFAKGGFGDGDMLDDILEDGGFDGMAERSVADDGMHDGESFCHAVLATLVVRKLEGLLPEGRIDPRASRSHNPVRAPRTPENEAALYGVLLHVSVGEILAVAEELAHEFVPRTTPRL